jgi:hypothetical protein
MVWVNGPGLGPGQVISLAGQPGKQVGGFCVLAKKSLALAGLGRRDA